MEMFVTGANKVNIAGDNPVRQWVAALFFVVTTVSTTGYGRLFFHLDDFMKQNWLGYELSSWLCHC